jgi:DNA modification methylase
MIWPPQGIEWYYSDDYTAIAHGDCREILPELPKVDMIFTDPPYGHNNNNIGDLIARREAALGKKAVPDSQYSQDHSE